MSCRASCAKPESPHRATPTRPATERQHTHTHTPIFLSLPLLSYSHVGLVLLAQLAYDDDDYDDDYDDDDDDANDYEYYDDGTDLLGLSSRSQWSSMPLYRPGVASIQVRKQISGWRIVPPPPPLSPPHPPTAPHPTESLLLILLSVLSSASVSTAPSRFLYTSPNSSFEAYEALGAAFRVLGTQRQEDKKKVEVEKKEEEEEEVVVVVVVEVEGRLVFWEWIVQTHFYSTHESQRHERLFSYGAVSGAEHLSACELPNQKKQNILPQYD
ncbi:hypothetical protein M0802_007993 [Mischocyttarus mexicanus]|nr:hypothetical protein M0802_007993 [Mischocyttarus mexicanus]